jgi:tetratricopeptide (TPR) repeat protein
MLLIIDDAWQLEDVLTLKIGGPHCAYLVTTRLPNIAAAAAPDRVIVLHELDEDEGLALLELLAPGIVVHEEQSAHDLVKAVGGLPLALTLIGNYVRMQTYSGQTRRIDAALAHLDKVEVRLQIGEHMAPTQLHPGLPKAAPLSLQTVFAVTDQQLDGLARSAMYALSVFPSKPGSFSEEAALAVAMCTVETLDTLFDAGLLESSSPGRYTVHQTVADYGRLHLQDVTAYERLIHYSADFAETHTQDYELLERESDLILTALERAYELGEQSALVRCTSAFAPFLILRGIYTVAERHLQRAYHAATELGDRYGMTTTLLYVGEVAQYLGRLEQSEHFLREGLDIAREIGDTDRISALLKDLGWVARKRGAYAQAEAYLQNGLMLARQLADQKRMCSLLTLLGSVVGIRGELRREIEYQKEALSLARQLGEREEMCIILTNLGVSSAETGAFSQAEEYFQEALSIARQMGDPELTCGALCNLTELKQAQGAYAQAERYAREGLDLARSIGHREWTAAILGNLGLVHRSCRKYDQADTRLQEAISIAREIDLPQLIATLLWEQSCLFLDTHQIEKADAALQEVLAISPEGSQDLVALAQYGLAQVAAGQGDVPLARELGETSLTALATIGHRKESEVQAWLATLGDQNMKNPAVFQT